MKNNMKCEVIRDLFPSYIDELTSEATNQVIEEHLSECKDCCNILEEMKTLSVEPLVGTEETIDYLKKVRRINRRKIVTVLLSVILVIGLIGLYIVFQRGTSLYTENIHLLKVQQEDGNVQLQAKLDKDLFYISYWKIKERELENGNVELVVDFRVAMGQGNKGMTDVYLTDKKVERVKFGDRVVWENGKDISILTNKVYETRHEFIGDAAANNKSALSIGLENVLGGFENELQTEKKPYVWKIKYPESLVDPEYAEELNNRFKRYGVIMLGVIGNLDEIEFDYWNGQQYEKARITKEEANDLLGFNVKKCKESIYYLQLAMEKNGFIAEEGPEKALGTMNSCLDKE